MRIDRSTLVVGFGTQLVVFGFLFLGEVGIGATAGQGSVCGTGRGVAASGLAAFATGAIAVERMVNNISPIDKGESASIGSFRRAASEREIKDSSISRKLTFVQ